MRHLWFVVYLIYNIVHLYALQIHRNYYEHTRMQRGIMRAEGPGDRRTSWDSQVPKLCKCTTVVHSVAFRHCDGCGMPDQTNLTHCRSGWRALCVRWRADDYRGSDNNNNDNAAFTNDRVGGSCVPWLAGPMGPLLPRAHEDIFSIPWYRIPKYTSRWQDTRVLPFIVLIVPLRKKCLDSSKHGLDNITRALRWLLRKVEKQCTIFRISPLDVFSVPEIKLNICYLF